MTKLELIQSIIKHRQAGAAMCTCHCIFENPKKVSRRCGWTWLRSAPDTGEPWRSATRLTAAVHAGSRDPSRGGEPANRTRSMSEAASVGACVVDL